MSQNGTGSEQQKVPASLDDMVRWHRQMRSKDGRVKPIQEHRMIVNAIDQGASLEQIAEALNLPVRSVRISLKRLRDIDEEVADLLKDKHISQNALRHFRRVSTALQREIAELMVCAANYSNAYVEALILATPKEHLAKPSAARMPEGIPVETIALMIQEMVALERDLKAVESGYGENMLNLTLARAYVRKLLNNPAVARFLSTQYADILAEFTALAATESL
jgi:hypothetical protein